MKSSTMALDRPRVKLYSRPGNDLTDRFPLIRRGAGQAALALLHHRRRGDWSPEGTKVPSGEYNRGLRARCPKSREPKEILMKAPRIAPLPKWKVDLVEEAIKLIEEEVGGPATAEIIGRRIPAFPIEDIRNAMAQLKKFG